MPRPRTVLRLRLRDGEPAIDLASWWLWEEGATAVEERGEGPHVELVAGFPTDEAALSVAETLGARGLDVLVSEVPEESWQDAWREWMEPVAAGRLLVVPAWRPAPVRTGNVGLLIDPGSCFGSGTHASTRLILEWLSAHPPTGGHVVDVGSGSGILSVAAARLGAAAVDAVDVDPEAVEITRLNADRNGVGGVVRATAAPVGDLPPGEADVVLVNVTAGVHAFLGPDCCRLLRPGATLVLSGLLEGQWKHVSASYSRLEPVDHLSLGGWEGAVCRLSP